MSEDRLGFECPRCHRAHTRGFVNGVDTFRCMNCGYTGRGFHPDPEVDAEVTKEIREAQEWNRAHGMEEGPFEP